MATDEVVINKTDAEVRHEVFNSFHAEGIALLPHDMLARIHKALVSQGTRMTTRNGLAAELAKLAPGVVR